MKNNKNNVNKTKINKKTVFAFSLVVIAFITVIYYMLGPSEGYIHSDCVDTLTWANATVESGQLFSSTFCYPYLLPFGSTFLFYPFVAMFGFTMFAYRLAMFVFMVLFALAIYFCARGLGWSRNTGLIAVSSEFIMVSSSVKLRELFWEHIIHYSLGAFLAFVLMAFMFYFITSYKGNKYSFKNNRKTIIFGVLVALWAFFSAFDGLTTLTLSTLPVLGALLLSVVFDTKNNIISKANKDIIVSFIIILVATILGCGVLALVTKNIDAGYGSAYSNIVESGEWSNNALKFLEQWTTLLGADYEVGGAITSGKNILAAIKMAGSLVLFFTPVYAVFIYKRVVRNERIFILFHWLMAGLILYGYVFGSLSSVNWRLSPIICSAVMVNIIVWKYLWNTVDLKRCAVIVSLLVVLSGVVTFGQIWSMPADYGRENDQHQVVKYLEEQGLNYGYATYWNANILTLISNSKVKVRDINLDNDQPVKGWLNTDKAWYNSQPNQDKYFVLLTNSEYDDKVSRNHSILDNTSEILRYGNWVILVKDNNIF